MAAAESKKGLSLLSNMTSLPRLLLIFDALGIEHPPKQLLPPFYHFKIAKKLDSFKSNIHVTFNSDFSVLLSLSNVKEARKEGGYKYLYTNEKGIIGKGEEEGGGGEGRPPTPPPPSPPDVSALMSPKTPPKTLTEEEKKRIKDLEREIEKKTKNLRH